MRVFESTKTKILLFWSSLKTREKGPGACFPKVPKLFGPISGATIDHFRYIKIQLGSEA